MKALESLVLLLGATGHPFEAPDSKNSGQKYAKDDFGGIVRKLIFLLYVFLLFSEVSSSSGAPKDGLEALLGRT